MAACKAPKCERTDIHGHGFCSRHYRQLRKGIIDHDGHALRKIKPRYSDSDACLVSNCFRRPKGGRLCALHYRKMREGQITEKGFDNPDWVSKRWHYGPNYECLRCQKQNDKFVLGMCRNCYNNHYLRGRIDKDGKSLYAPRKKKEPAAPRKEPRPKMTDCICLMCDRKAHSKGLCRLHYARQLNSGVAYIARDDNPNWKNTGKTCTVPNCREIARSLTLCGKHYYRHQRGLPPDFDRRCAGRTCIAPGCTKEANCKKYCKTHYARVRFGRPLEPVVKSKTCLAGTADPVTIGE